MKRNFCCPDCGCESVYFAREKSPFSLAKALLGMIFLGPVGFLLGFIGQSEGHISVWYCPECLSVFNDPKHECASLERNREVWNKFINIHTIIVLVIETIILLIYMIPSLVNPILLIVWLIVAVFAIGWTLLVYSIVKSLVNKYFDRRIYRCMQRQKKINNFFSRPVSGNFESY